MGHQDQINIADRSVKAKKLPWFMPSMCDGCASCVNACPLKILRMEETALAGVYIPRMCDYYRCIACGKCTDSCAMGAVAMTGYIREAVERYIIE